jgi:serine/threonine protein kinase
MKQYENIKKRGQGASGSVFEAVDTRKKITHIIKIMSLSTKNNANRANRDLFFLQELQKIKNLTPKLYHHWKCLDQLFLAMDVFDGDCLELGVSQFQRFFTTSGHALLYTIKQFRDLYRLVSDLTDAGVIHGDLKPNNFLHRKGNKIVITDFGTSGDYKTFKPNQGWSQNLSCPIDDVPEKFLKYFNIWQFETSLLLMDDIVFILDDNGDKMYIFTGFDTKIIPRETRQELQQHCDPKTINAFAEAMFVKRTTAAQLFGLSFLEITTQMMESTTTASIEKIRATV